MSGKGAPGFDPWAGQIFAEGGWRPAASPGRRRIVNPSTLAEEGAIALVGAAEAAEVARSVAAAQKGWAATDPRSRAAVLHRIADAIARADPEPVAAQMVREMGKPYAEAVGELANVAPAFRYFAEMARDEAGKIAGASMPGSFQYEIRQPYGVSLHILPFNYPILLMAWTVAASLAAGNGVIVKPAEATSLSTLRFMAQFAALPPGLIACLPGDGATAQALIAAPEVQAVAFTGSVEAGRRVAVACAERTKPCIVEAGGNDPMIVCADAPLDVAAAGAVTASFHLSGQICTSTERIYVEAAAYEPFLDAFAARTRALRIGDGFGRTEIGPLVSEAARDRMARLVEDARARGARILCGGAPPPGRNTGWFWQPTILADATPEMAVMREEVFGPVVAVMKVPDLEAALALANASPFGLGASIFTTRLDHAMRAAEAFEAGLVWVNNPLIDNDALPFGGWKASGLGRELGRQGLDAFRRSKMVVIDPVPRLQGWWYPYGEDAFHPSSRDREEPTR